MDAALPTVPPYTVSHPFARLERRNDPVMVEDAVEMKPFNNPIVVVVDTPYEVAVKGKTLPLPQPVQVPEIIRSLVTMPLYSFVDGVVVPI